MATATMRDGRPRCRLCAASIKPPDTLCVECRIAPPAFERIVAAFDYASPGDILVRQWKVNLRYTHVRLMADLVMQAVQTAQLSLPASTILTAVPSSASSILHRGFNPSAELARQLSRHLSLSLRPGLLRRESQGDKQAGLTHSERASNVMGLYRCMHSLQGQVVLVVDDVLTTGATLDAIARTLKRAGAGRVFGVVAARTPPTDT
jgi:ComF family protein